jgi:hypothetical protein
MSEKEIGIITHWFDKIGVAVIKLTDTLSVGDKIKIKRGNEEFEDTVASMQIDHKEVSSAQKDDEAALKLSNKAHEGSKVYKIE